MLFCTDVQVLFASVLQVESGVWLLTKLFTTIMPTNSITIIDIKATTTPPAAFLECRNFFRFIIRTMPHNIYMDLPPNIILVDDYA